MIASIDSNFATSVAWTRPERKNILRKVITKTDDPNWSYMLHLYYPHSTLLVRHFSMNPRSRYNDYPPPNETKSIIRDGTNNLEIAHRYIAPGNSCIYDTAYPK